jgi:nitroreductase
MSKKAETNHPVLEVIADRWSPYGFDSRPVPGEDLLSILEAARWAASSFNEQPWRFVVATSEEPDLYDRVRSCLNENNQAWAGQAPVLMLGIYKKTFTHNGKPNGIALHDLGLAAATLTLEATSRGLFVHQMAGILPDRAREEFAVPEDFEIVTGFALGYAADPSILPDALRERDTKPRSRKPLGEIVIGKSWGDPSTLVD